MNSKGKTFREDVFSVFFACTDILTSSIVHLIKLDTPWKRGRWNKGLIKNSFNMLKHCSIQRRQLVHKLFSWVLKTSLQALCKSVQENFGCVEKNTRKHISEAYGIKNSSNWNNIVCEWIILFHVELFAMHQLPMTEVTFVNWLRSIIYFASLCFAFASNKFFLLSVKIIKHSACRT